jgi:hypothetical protein
VRKLLIKSTRSSGIPVSLSTRTIVTASIPSLERRKVICGFVLPDTSPHLNDALEVSRFLNKVVD